MPYLSSSDYIKAREAYAYTDFDVTFNIVQTGTLPYVGEFRGIFPRVVPLSHPTGINIRKFEIICSSVFCDANFAEAKKSSTPIHIANLKAVICAIVHWKMASQGGRAPRNEQNVLNKWQSNTYAQLLEAYNNKSLPLFKIGGVRIPTATAIIRFLYPDFYGIMDSRVVKNHTEPKKITSLNLRPADGYINDVKENLTKYETQYVPFLVSEANALVAAGVKFCDIDHDGTRIYTSFRPCDIEMALFV